MGKKTEKQNKRPGWFEGYKNIIKIGIKKSEFIYLGERPTEAGVILSNHVGTSAPLAWELYEDIPFRFWGAYEMNSGLVNLYKYQTQVFYHEKKHWNIHLARLFCLLASPLTYFFYKGLNLISTYRDARFRHTISESIDTIKSGKSIIIFPEISDKGYLDELEGFHKGFVMLLRICHKKGMDFPIYVSYYRKRERRYIIDRPVMLSELFSGGMSGDEIADMLCRRCNELGKLSLDELGEESAKDESDRIKVG